MAQTRPFRRDDSRFLVLVESNTTGTGKLFARVARNLGLRPLLVSKDPSRYPYVCQDEIEVLGVDTTDFCALEEAVCLFAERNFVAGIYSSSEYWIEMVARIASRLDLPGTDPEAVAMCRNKWRQRKLLEACAVRVPAFHRARSIAETRRILKDLTFPVIVKPTQGSGSVGVRLCSDANEVVRQAQVLLAQEVNERGLPVPPELLIEEYIVGTEYSVEMFGLEVIGVTRKYLSSEPYFIETGHDFPADLSPGTDEKIRQVSVQALLALGLTWGPVHVELRIPASEAPVIIEVNPRLAGGFIPELVRQSSGIDLIEATVVALLGSSPKFHTTDLQHASIRFLVSKTRGVLSAVDGLQIAASVKGVTDVMLYRKPGECVGGHGDFRDRLGHVIACHQSALVARTAVQHAMEVIQARIH